MSRKLNTSVHVVALSDPDARGNREVTNQGVFGPDDDLPGWAEKAITNPDVWADSSEDGPAQAEAKEASTPRRSTSK